MMPWNGYDSVQVITGDFTSIAATGTRIEGSQNAGPDGQVFTFAFNDFPIGFLQQVYAAPVSMKISTHGWISFNGSVGTTSTPIPQMWYTTSTAHPYNNKVLMGYWCNLRTDDVPSGGIYWRSTSVTNTVDGVTASRRCLIIEWIARTSLPGTVPGRFQVRIFERAGLALNSMIEWQFSTTSIDLPPATEFENNYGAQVGVKNFGNVGGDPAIVGDPAGLDREKSLIVANPQQLPALARRAVTRLRTMNAPNGVGGTTPYKPEWWAYYARYYTEPTTEWSSPYYHYSFPGNGGGKRPAYRMKPVIVDMGASGITMNGLDASNPSSIEAGSEAAPQLSFANLGAYTLKDIPFTLDIYRILISGVDPTPVEHFDGTIDSIAGGNGRVVVPGYGKRAYFIQTPGLYRISVRVSGQGDQNPFNDTITGSFIVRGGVDLVPREVVQPRSNTAPEFTTYRVGEAVPFVARFMNAGHDAARNVTVGYTVVDDLLNRVDSGSTLIASLPGMDSATALFTSQWVPSRPGRYYFKTYVVGTPDQTPQDDTLPSAPSPGRPFEVFYEVDAGVGDSVGNEPRAPGPNGGTRGIAIPLMATILNNGPALLRSIPVHVSVTDASGAEVFNTTGNAVDVPGSGSAQVTFNGFVPQSAGEHCVTVSVSVVGDAVRGNDTARWCFAVTTSGGVTTVADHDAGLAVDVAPNPAHASAVITYRRNDAGATQAVLTDLYGNEVWRSDEKHGTTSGTFEVRTSELPTGVYVVQVRTTRGMVATKLTITH